MKNAWFVSGAVLGVVIAASWSMAETIAIDNPSFELDGVQVDVPGWVDVDESSPYSVYQSGPNAANYFPTGDLDGSYFLLVDGYEGMFYAYQDTGATFVPGYEYTLTVAVGRRADHDELNWADTPWMFSLNHADSGMEAASLSGSIPNGDGGAMTDQSLVYVAQAADAGKGIRVLIGRAAADPWVGQSTGYDNVRLSVVVPEPSCFAMLLGGLLLFAGLARREGR